MLALNRMCACSMLLRAVNTTAPFSFSAASVNARYPPMVGSGLVSTEALPYKETPEGRPELKL